MSRSLISRLLTLTTIAGTGILISAPALSVPALALDATGNVTINATLAESCTISTNNIAFGQLAYGADAAVTSSFDVDCLAGTLYTISLDDGANEPAITNSTGTYAAGRKMANTGGQVTAYIPYTLHQVDPTFGGAPTIETTYENTLGVGTPFVGIGVAQEYALYAFVDGTDTTNKPTGSYSDTVVVTVSY